jgi:hypothetical protein
MTRHLRFPVALLVAVVVAGCGGDDSTPSGGTCSSDAFRVTADASIPLGKAAGATLASSCGAVTDVQWRQTAGATVSILSAQSQAISIEPATTGSYSFTVDFRDVDTIRRSLSVTINAVFPVAPVSVVVRADQAVREGGSASVRAWPAAAPGETITWTQVSGPTVVLDTSDQNRALFTAPAVTEDSVIVLRATRQLVGGGTDSDDVRVLVEHYQQAPSDAAGTGPYVFSDYHVSRVHPYRANGRYAAVLVPCTYEANLQYTGAAANMCPLSKLPFLNQTTGGIVPSVSQIMDRVVVSHDWMGQVFEDFLTTQASDDMKRLLNGVTAIVIGAHVRPSFYYALTGAIYLDAENFWLTAEQRDVIDEQPDFRSDFDLLLNYSTAWRYTENNQSIFINFPATTRIPRTQSYLLAEAGWLLYHELGHASDFVPPSVRSSLDSNLSVWANISPRYATNCLGSLPSDDLCRTWPLTSAEMFALAQVKFWGATPTAAQIAYTPDTVAYTFFAPDRATDDYNYSTIREDLAMLFEEFMMYRNHGWRRDMAITDKITDTTTSSTLIVRWGQRGRIGAPAVKTRVQLVVGALAPWVSPSEVTSLPSPIQMRPGESWASNLVQPAPLAGAMSLGVPPDFTADRASLMGDLGRRSGQWTPNDRWLRRAGH